MSDSRHHTETRSETIFRHTRAMIASGQISWKTFLSRVAERYCRQTPALVRCIQFRFETEDDLDANVKKLRRLEEQPLKLRMPLDLEEAWVQELLEPYKSACLADLSLRFGLLPAALPQACAMADSRRYADYMGAAAGPIPLIAMMLANGTIDPDDEPLAEEAKRELRGVITAATQMIAQIDLQVFGRGPQAKGE